MREIRPLNLTETIIEKLNNEGNDSLIRIFESKYADCRKKLLGLFPDLSVNKEALPNKDLETIREKAAILFLQRKIHLETDPEKLLDFFKRNSDLDLSNKLPFSIKPSKKRIPEMVNEELKKRLLELTPPNFEQYVQKKITSASADYVDTYFKNYPLRKFLTESEAEKIVATHYVDSALNQLKWDELLAATKNTDDYLNKKIQNFAFCIDKLPDGTLRTMVFKKIIKTFQLSNGSSDITFSQCMNFSNAKKLDRFKQVSKDFFQDYSLLTQENMKAIQEVARARAFEIKTKERSPLLEQAFGRLTPERQKELLNDEEKLSVVINFHTLRDIKIHLAEAVSDEQAKAILEENNNLKLFNLIHNSEVARMLADLQPAIKLNEEHVQAINSKLKPPVDIKAFKEFLKTTFAHAQDVVENAFKADPEQAEEIFLQESRNKYLFQDYNDPLSSNADKKLISLFLNLEKLKTVSSEDFDKIKFHFYQPIEPDVIMYNLRSQKNSDFRSGPPLKFNIWELEKSKEELREIQKLKRMEMLKSGDDALVETAREQLHILLNKQKEQRAHIERVPKEIPGFEKVFHFYGSYFKNRPVYGDEIANKNKIKEANCDVYLDILYRQEAFLDDHIKLMTSESIDIPSLKEEIQSQKLAVQKLIEDCRNLKKQLKDINRAIHLARQKEYLYVVKPQGFVISEQKDGDEYVSKPKGRQNGITLASCPMQEPNALEKSIILDLKPGQTRIYAMGEGQPERYIERVSLRRDGDKSRTFEMEEFPEDPQKRVHYAMAMAHSILASRKGPPSASNPIRLKGENEVELKYLWTALMVLGSVHDQMKFGAEALDCSRSRFDPKDEKGRVWGYSKNSLHTQEFESKIDTLKNNFRETMVIKFENKNMEPSTRAASNQYKEGMKELIQRGKKVIKEQGLALPVNDPLAGSPESEKPNKK